MKKTKIICTLGPSTEKQKDLLRELDDSMTENSNKHNPQSRSWMDGVKKFFDDMKF